MMLLFLGFIEASCSERFLIALFSLNSHCSPRTNQLAVGRAVVVITCDVIIDLSCHAYAVTPGTEFYCHALVAVMLSLHYTVYCSALSAY